MKTAFRSIGNMKALVMTWLTLAAVISVTTGFMPDLEDITAFQYLKKIGIPLATKLREAEEQSDQNPYRIVGGHYSYIIYFPYQVGLIAVTPDGDAICGGSLISKTRVLTAGHCWFDGETQAWKFKVVLGSTRLYGNDGIRFDTALVITHPQFSPPITNDIAMILLPHTVEYSSTISPIALPSGKERNQSFVGWVGMASGYGFISDTDSVDNERYLSYVYLPLVSRQQCYPFQDIDFSKQVCASGEGGRSTCQGDSGGPIVVNSNNRRVLVGIVSFGSSSGCQKGYPSVYTRVSAYLNWITLIL
ncbi:hypothetical protein PYW07_013764 [Mythimna separata]|uniref:Peptidase S1 domain-containing protein n=1 Tax=Mythimna separata TaxID=271217 RepID=A0AAD7YFR8_MYTSE|nr:hypothetical protein PYW07_013764 [Mythimna separata]